MPTKKTKSGDDVEIRVRDTTPLPVFMGGIKSVLKWDVLPLKKLDQKLDAKKPTESIKKIVSATELDSCAPTWLTEDLPRRSPYFPQVADEIYYFEEGHEKFVELISESKYTPFAQSKLPYANKKLEIQVFMSAVSQFR